jgi:hypothetical protein
MAVVGWLLVSPAAGLAFELPDATADYESVRDGGPPTRGKIYVSKGRFRSETGIQAATVVLIVDPSAKRLWFLLPPPMGCITQPLTEAVALNTPLLPSKDAKEELVGSETVAGHPTKKYKITTTIDGATRVQYVWRATDLKGFPVQSADEDGNIKATFTNIKLGKTDPKRFRTPANCKPLAPGRAPARK